MTTSAKSLPTRIPGRWRAGCFAVFVTVALSANFSDIYNRHIFDSDLTANATLFRRDRGGYPPEPQKVIVPPKLDRLGQLLAEELLRGLKRQGSPSVTVTIKRVDTVGIPWFPVYKNGRCRVELETSSVFENSRKDTELDLSVDFTVWGFCRPASLDASLASYMAKTTLKQKLLPDEAYQ